MLAAPGAAAPRTMLRGLVCAAALACVSQAFFIAPNNLITPSKSVGVARVASGHQQGVVPVRCAGRVRGCTVNMMAGGGTRRDVLRMPSSEPMVPYKPDGAQRAQWMSVTQLRQRERTVMVGRFIDDEYANQLIALLLYLEKESPGEKIKLQFNCPGALIRPALALYDTMKYIVCDIETLNLGLATGMVSFLIAAGTPGERYCMPNSRFLMQRTGMEDPYQGQASDIGVQVRHVLKGNDKMEEALQRITGHSITKIREDFQRDFYLSAAEAVQYGIVDEVLLPSSKYV